jgi:hypothetical protein
MGSSPSPGTPVAIAAYQEIAMPCCLWCLKEMPDARSWRVDDHLRGDACRRAFREADIRLLTTVASAMEQDEFDLGAVQEGCHG